MFDPLRLCLDKRFETPALQEIFNLRTQGESSIRRRRKRKYASKDETQDEGEKMMLGYVGTLESEPELAVQRDFVRLVSSSSAVGPSMMSDLQGWALRLRVGWEVFRGEYGLARAILRQALSETTVGNGTTAPHASPRKRSLELDPSRQQLPEEQRSKRRKAESCIGGKRSSAARRQRAAEAKRPVLKDAPTAGPDPLQGATNKKQRRRERAAALKDPNQASALQEAGSKAVKPKGNKQKKSAPQAVQTQSERKSTASVLAPKSQTPIRAVLAQANSLEDYVNRQALTTELQIPVIPKEKIKRGPKQDSLTERLGHRLLATLDLRHVNPAVMAEFTAKQPSKRVRLALERASRSGSPMTPLPEEKEEMAKHLARKARAERGKADRGRAASPLAHGQGRLHRPAVVLPEGGIPAKTFRAVMRLVLGLPLLPAQPRVRMRVPPRRPPVWAESRQELCEALPYYRAFQSSLYMHKRTAFSYLLDGYPSPRDAWAAEGRIVISHGGGQCVRTVRLDGTPVVSLQADQSPTDARVDALLQSEKNRTPIILIAGEGYAQLPWKLSQAYAVLGWYWVSHTWVEAEYPGIGVQAGPKGYFLRYKIRFDWIGSQGTPWWLCGTDPKTDMWMSDAPGRPLGNVPVVCGHDGINISSSTAGRSRQSMTAGLKDETHQDGDTDGVEEVTGDVLDMQRQLFQAADEVKVEGAREPDSRVRHRHDRHLPGQALLAPLVPKRWYTMKCRDIGAACPTCGKNTPVVYAEGWICLHPECRSFWMLHDWPIPPGFTLTYASSFLERIPTPPELSIPPYDLRPPAPHASDEAMSVDGRTLWRGWVCDRCGRANCRFRWEVWECKACGQLLAPLGNSITPAKHLQTVSPMLGDVDIHPGADILTTLFHLPSTLVSCYELPDGDGRVYHLRHTETGWADKLFEDYQHEASGTTRPLFERKPLKGTAIKGQLLAQHFAVNSGATYKYNVESMSLTFADSPACVMQALETIKARVAAVLNEHAEFNEILSVLYRDGQKMSWHDDGEPGLGDVVSSLSLGSPAVMSWRPKAHRGKNKYIMGLSHRGGHPPTALSITLAHGDIVIMQGRKMQEKYEHRVVPRGLRVAATARVIGQDHR